MNRLFYKEEKKVKNVKKEKKIEIVDFNLNLSKLIEKNPKEKFINDFNNLINLKEKYKEKFNNEFKEILFGNKEKIKLFAEKNYINFNIHNPNETINEISNKYFNIFNEIIIENKENNENENKFFKADFNYSINEKLLEKKNPFNFILNDLNLKLTFLFNLKTYEENDDEDLTIENKLSSKNYSNISFNKNISNNELLNDNQKKY